MLVSAERQTEQIGSKGSDFWPEQESFKDPRGPEIVASVLVPSNEPLVSMNQQMKMTKKKKSLAFKGLQIKYNYRIIKLPSKFDFCFDVVS